MDDARPLTPGRPIHSALERDLPPRGWTLSLRTLDLDAGAGSSAPLRLCACCVGNLVPADSDWTPLFCSWCGPRIIALDRAAGRLAVPVARDAEANRSLFPVPGSEDDGTARYTADLALQLEHLDTWRRLQTRALLTRLGLGRRGSIDLTDFLVWSAGIPAPAFGWESRLVALLDWFAEYLLDTPDTSADLRARIDEVARGHVGALSEPALAKVRPAPEHRLAAMAGRWARELIDEVQPLPAIIDRDAPALEARRAITRRALQAALIREVDRIARRFSRPTPAIPMNIECPQVYFGVFTTPPASGDRPHWLPTSCPRGARLVCALEGVPEPLTRPITFFRLSLDSRHRFWILWAGWTDAQGIDVTAPAAFGPRGGLADVEAAYLMLEGFLTKLRGQGALRESPRFALTGMLGETLAAHLLRSVGNG